MLVFDFWEARSCLFERLEFTHKVKIVATLLGSYGDFGPLYSAILIRTINKVDLTDGLSFALHKCALSRLYVKLFGLIIDKLNLERPLSIFKLDLNNRLFAYVRTNRDWLVFGLSNLNFQWDFLGLIFWIVKCYKPVVLKGLIDNRLQAVLMCMQRSKSKRTFHEILAQLKNIPTGDILDDR